MFDYDPIQANGKQSVISLFWCAGYYRKKGDADWLDVDDVPAECPCPACVDLKAQSQPVLHTVPRANPGAAHSAWTQVRFASLAEAEKWVTITDSMNIQVKLPKRASPSDPALAGDLCTIKVSEDQVKSGGGTEKKDVEYELNILVELHMYGVEFGTLGGAVGGAGLLRTTGGLSPAAGMANTVAHEIAHNCGQTYVQFDGTTVGGRAVGPIAGVPWGAKVPDGPYYVGHGHQGSHCLKPVFDLITSPADRQEHLVQATGATSEVPYNQPSGDHWDQYFSKVKDEDHCIMYGEGDPDVTTGRKFCDLCVGYLRVTDLANVTKNW